MIEEKKRNKKKHKKKESEVDMSIISPTTTSICYFVYVQDSNPNPLAKAQLDLLSKLIARPEKKTTKTEFRLNLFSTDEEE